MSYRNDQGRYARMVAFWGVTLIAAYGCFHGGGLVMVLNGWLGEHDATIVDPFPLLGTLRISTSIAIGLMIAAAWFFHSVLNRPRIADTLIDTESEMNKVTWPNWPETWAGSLAVGGMVLVLFVFLTGADLFLSWLMQRFVGGAS